MEIALLVFTKYFTYSLYMAYAICNAYNKLFYKLQIHSVILFHQYMLFFFTKINSRMVRRSAE